jgi:hypothetical protein
MTALPFAKRDGRLDDVLSFLVENSGEQSEASLPLMNSAKVRC